MRLFFSAPISYSKLYEGWYYENPVFRLPALFVNDKQLVAAALTRKMMESLHGTIAHDAAKELLEELTNTVDNPLSIHTTVDTKWVDSRIVFLEDEYEAVNPEIWKTISECLRYNYELEFMYKGLLYKEHVLRRVRPYQLLYSRSAWTLWGYDVTPRKILLFRLNRMRMLQQTRKNSDYLMILIIVKRVPEIAVYGYQITDMLFQYYIMVLMHHLHLSVSGQKIKKYNNMLTVA